MRKLTLIILVALIALSCKDDKLNNKLVAGVHSWPGGGVIYIGEEKGFFKENGIDLEIQKIENFDTKRASLISGNIDLDIANTMDQALIYFDNSFKAEIIGITDESVGGDGLVVGMGIKSVTDLKGKTIAYAEASPSDFFLRYLLNEKGIPLDSVSLKPVADPQIAGTSFISGSVDAAVTYEPFLSQSLSNEGSSILFSTKEYPTLIPGLIIANGEDIALRSDIYKKFMSAWFKSVEYYKNNSEESYAIISKGMGMDVKEVKEILKVVDIQSKAQNIKLFDKSTNANIYELTKSIGEFWKSNGFIKSNDNLDQIINSSLILD
jgi:NitT/TauT family transport system substrate-binding protein